MLSLQGKTGIVGDDEYASWEFRTMAEAEGNELGYETIAFAVTGYETNATFLAGV